MTLFSPKALVAGATAAALTFTGAGVASAQSSFAGSSESTTAEGEANNSDISSEDSFVYNLFIGSTNDDGELDPKEFSTWINTINSLLRTMDGFLSL